MCADPSSDPPWDTRPRGQWHHSVLGEDGRPGGHDGLVEGIFRVVSGLEARVIGFVPFGHELGCKAAARHLVGQLVDRGVRGALRVDGKLGAASGDARPEHDVAQPRPGSCAMHGRARAWLVRKLQLRPSAGIQFPERYC